MKKLLKYLLYYIIFSYFGNVICFGLINGAEVLRYSGIDWDVMAWSPLTFPDVLCTTLVFEATYLYLLLGSIR